MFKRFSANYMAVLLLLDGFIIQVSLWLGMELRYILPFGQVIRPEWAPRWLYVPTVDLHVAVGALWLASFLIAALYTPRKIIHWYDEFQRLVFAHTMAALSLAGALYLANIELLRLAFLYFYLLSLLGLVGYRVLLRFWHRMRREDPSICLTPHLCRCFGPLANADI